MLLTAYKIIYISMLVCAFLIFLPPLRIIVLLIAILAVVASFAFAIYELLPAFLIALAANVIVSNMTPEPEKSVQMTFDRVTRDI